MTPYLIWLLPLNYKFNFVYLLPLSKPVVDESQEACMDLKSYISLMQQ